MGLFSLLSSSSSSESRIRRAEEYVRQCERTLECMKERREAAKKSGNYKSAIKNYRVGTKVGTIQDYNVWNAEDHLRKAKKALAEAKKNK